MVNVDTSLARLPRDTDSSWCGESLESSTFSMVLQHTMLPIYLELQASTAAKAMSLQSSVGIDYKLLSVRLLVPPLWAVSGCFPLAALSSHGSLAVHMGLGAKAGRTPHSLVALR